MSGFKGATTQRMRDLKSQPLLKKSDIEREYHVSRRTISRLIESGKLTPVRIGSSDRIAESEWLRHLATAHASTTH